MIDEKSGNEGLQEKVIQEVIIEQQPKESQKKRGIIKKVVGLYSVKKVIPIGELKSRGTGILRGIRSVFDVIKMRRNFSILVESNQSVEELLKEQEVIKRTKYSLYYCAVYLIAFFGSLAYFLYTFFVAGITLSVICGLLMEVYILTLLIREIFAYRRMRQLKMVIGVKELFRYVIDNLDKNKKNTKSGN